MRIASVIRALAISARKSWRNVLLSMVLGVSSILLIRMDPVQLHLVFIRNSADLLKMKTEECFICLYPKRCVSQDYGCCFFSACQDCIDKWNAVNNCIKCPVCRTEQTKKIYYCFCFKGTPEQYHIFATRLFIIELIITLILYIYSIPNKIEFNEGPE
jgi:hypothetical protein